MDGYPAGGWGDSNEPESRSSFRAVPVLAHQNEPSWPSFNSSWSSRSSVGRSSFWLALLRVPRRPAHGSAGTWKILQVGMPLRALSQNRESRAGAMSSDASGECRTTSESFVKKNFSIDFSISALKHRSPAEHLKVNEVDQFRDSKFVSDLVRCGRAM